MADSGQDAPRRPMGRGRGAGGRSKSAARPGPDDTSTISEVSTASTIIAVSTAASLQTVTTTTTSSSGASGSGSGSGKDGSTTTAIEAPKPRPGLGRGKSMTKLTMMPVGAAAFVPKSSETEASATESKTSSSSDSIELLPRPGYCQAGRNIQLRSNFFTVDIKGAFKVMQYIVEITGDGFKRMMTREDCYEAFWRTARDMNWIDEPNTVLYDGGNVVYALKMLDLHGATNARITMDLFLPRSQRMSKYIVSIRESKQFYIDYANIKNSDRKSRLLALSILDLVWRQTYNIPRDQGKPFYPFGRCYFNPPTPNDNTCFDLNAGRQTWSGYYFAAKWGVDFVPILNIDVANSVFFKKQSVLEYLCEVLNEAAKANKYRMEQLETMNRPVFLSQHEIVAFSKALKGYWVTSRNNPRQQQKVDGVSEVPAEQLTFSWRTEKDRPEQQISVAEYFTKRYGPLRFPFFPCLRVGGKRESFLPFEYCDLVTPQRVRGKLSDTQTSIMIKGVCTDAVERERRVLNMIKKANMELDPFAAKFGMKLNTRPMDMQGRVLNPPAIQYTNGSAYPKDGTWTMSRGNQLFTKAKITSYAVLSFIGTGNDVATFCRNLMGMAVQMGMSVASSSPDSVQEIRTLHDVRDKISNAVSDCAKKGKNCDLIIIPMFSKDSDIYAAIKTVGDRDFGVPTQVVISRNINPIKPQTLSNIVYKINTKLGGINCRLVVDIINKKYISDQSTLILGLDVTHPGPGDRKTPSIGAAVGNIDTIPAQFAASIYVQTYRKESCLYLTTAIRSRLQDFWTKCGVKPERIIMYRDGVAEGQFHEVLREEIKGLMMALKEIPGDVNTKITFIVVQKRHHTRFFCSEMRDQTGRGKNVPPGTVVDKTVTEPDMFDFYLCSHFGIQGTSRPTHYYVLRDDNKFTPDELQAITYQLCHLYARCTRSVSIPAPTYYAHLACERARHHFNHTYNDESDAKSVKSFKSGASSTASTISVVDPEKEEIAVQHALTVADCMKSQAYFV